MKNRTDLLNRIVSMLNSRRIGIILLISVCVLSLLIHAARGYLQPILNPDSEGYIQFQWDLSEKGLNGFRTPGYPLFLQSVMNCFGLDAVPTAHALAYFASIILFHGSLLAIGYRPFAAVAITVPLALGVNLSYLGQHILADSLALSTSIMAMAAFAWTFRRPGQYRSWLALAGLTFITYQIRPAYLFLLVLWPLMGIWTTLFLESKEDAFKRSVRRFVSYLAVSIIPFFSYTIIRGIFTGYFGLVAFGGYNIIGISIQFLDEPTIAQLPEEVQPLSRSIVNRIEELDLKVDITSYSTMEPNYPAYVYLVSVHEAKKIFGEDVRKINDAFNKISINVFKIHPKLYLRWIVGNLFHGVGDQVLLTFRNFGTVFVFLCVGIVVFLSLWRKIDLDLTGANPLAVTDERTFTSGTANGSLIGQSAFREFHFIFWLSLWYSAGKTSLVVLVEPSVGRYMAPASVLWPSVIAMAALHFLQSLSSSQSPASTRLPVEIESHG